LDVIPHYLFNGLIIVLVFGLAVFIHEFGHLIFAVLRGVGVESFAIGMGPKLTVWRWHGIEFSLRWFPIGGFVKLAGLMPGEQPPEQPDDGPQTHAYGPAEQTNSVELGRDLEEPPVKEPGEKSLGESSYDDLMALANKGLLTKLLVFGGGVFMNYVIAVVAMALLLMLPKQMPVTEPRIWSVKPDSQAARAGFRADDRIVAVNGVPIRYSYQMDQAIEDLLDRTGMALDDNRASSYALTFTVERRSNDGTTATARLADVPLGRYSRFLNDQAIDFVRPPVIGRVNVGVPADKAGLKAGDRIVAIDGRPIRTFNQLVDVITRSAGVELNVQYERDGRLATTRLKPFSDPLTDNSGKIGILSGAERYQSLPGLDPLHAVLAAPGQTWRFLIELFDLQVQFFRKASFTQVSEGLGGPILIFRMTARAANMGLTDLVHFFILLNLLLMIFNLIPLPVLDGGFLMLSLIEAVIRRPIPPKILAPIYTFFVIFFIGLMALITFWDVKRWIS
jgi:regulator of sigma E protease